MAGSDRPWAPFFPFTNFHLLSFLAIIESSPLLSHLFLVQGPESLSLKGLQQQHFCLDMKSLAESSNKWDSSVSGPFFGKTKPPPL